MTHRALVIPVVGPVWELMIPDDDVDASLAALQDAVGGTIQAVPVPRFVAMADRATVYCNDDGKGLGLPFNGRATDFMVPGAHLMWGDYIAGALVVAGFDPATGEHDVLPEPVEARVRLIEREAGQ